MVHSEAEEAKKKGNDCMKEKKFIEAMLHYTQAIKLDVRNHLVYSNRSLAFLKMDQYYHAMEDAYKVIELQPQWPKGYFRKGEVESTTEHFSEALMSFRQGLSMDPDDIGLQTAVTRASKKLKEQTTREYWIPAYGLLGGLVLGMLVILGDDVLTKKPTLNGYVTKMAIWILFAGFGFVMSKGYRYMVRSQRDGLLDAPVDLFTGEKEKSTITKPNSNAEPGEMAMPGAKGRKGGSAAGRQRYKMGKS